jgi:TatA/E family protein of Tat protein translocase
MFGSIGLPEILLILAIALLVFGPRKLPEMGRALGRAIAEFRKGSQDLKRTLESDLREVEEAARVQDDPGSEPPPYPPPDAGGKPPGKPEQGPGPS